MLTNNEFDMWVSALKSGKYSKCEDSLRDGDYFCALGVLLDILEPDGWRYNKYGDWEHTLENTDTISSNYIDEAYQKVIIDMNDGVYDERFVKVLKEYPKSFNEIADWLVSNRSYLVI